MTAANSGPASATTTLDALAPGHPGRWSDGRITVCHDRRQAVAVRLLGGRAPDAVTEHFRVHRTAGGLVVRHRLFPDELDDDLAGMVSAELGGGGLIESPDDFRRVFTGVVRSTISDPVTAWSVFYANTLAVLADPGAKRDPGSVAGFAPVAARAASLVTGERVLDVGSCFGFLALRLADRGHRVIASDLCRGTVRLLRTVAGRLGRSLSTVVCDAGRLPLADSAVDTVTVIHLLEHLDPAHGTRAVSEALRVARRRVVVAVPFEAEPTAVYGHVRTFDLAALRRLGARTGLPYDVSEHHGGWLVIDTR